MILSRPQPGSKPVTAAGGFHETHSVMPDLEFLPPRLRSLAAGLVQGRIGVLVRAVSSYLDAGGPLLSAGLAYYALFALLPLLVVLALLVGTVLTADAAMALVERLTGAVLPGAASGMVVDTLRALEAQRGTIGLLAALGLLWSATTGLGVLIQGVDRAFQRPSGTDMVRHRLKGLAIVLVLGLFLLGALAASVLIRVLATVGLDGTGLVSQLANALSWLLPVVGLMALYRWGPALRPPWVAVTVAAGAAGLSWRLALMLFAWYLTRGFDRYQVVYGALTGAIVLLLWLYVSASIVLLGAHLCASLTRGRDSGE
jgi:membrane protein